MPPLCRDVDPAPRQTRFAMSDACPSHISPFPTAPILVSLIKERFHIIGVVVLKDSIPLVLVRLPIKQDHVMHRPVSLRATVGACAFPNNLVQETRWPEDGIEQELEGSGADRIAGAIRSGVRPGDAAYAAMT